MSVINGKAYDWSEVDLHIPGLNVEVQEISYEDELEKEAVYGKGSKARGYGQGNYKVSGKISLLRDDYDDLIAYCKNKGVPFYKLVIEKIVVSYGNENRPITTDVLTKVTFAKRTGGGKQGDKNLLVDLDMVIFGELIANGLKAL